MHFLTIGRCKFQTFYLWCLPWATTRSHWAKQALKKLNLWGKTAVDKSAWIKASYSLFRAEKKMMHVRVVHETCTKHRLEGHEISCTNIIFHGNQYILLLHHVFMAINKIKITCFDLQAMTASRSVQVPHCSLRT